ncbi:hypothetical protein QJS10_CPB20g00968 [Acorus calamus]|uniref:Uncharacterized protein n=1 Tax=Acorus calamus TaxID=4465 RepID=A0AAV9C9N3_ACOCL|nr:hypothetical protein QJS10_CPB20g00968 [Acorus calamus]
MAGVLQEGVHEVLAFPRRLCRHRRHHHQVLSQSLRRGRQELSLRAEAQVNLEMLDPGSGSPFFPFICLKCVSKLSLLC